MKIQYYLFLVGMLMAFALPIAHADTYQVNFSNPYAKTAPNDPTLIVQVLKYDPYPVSAGEWFNVWIQVQNVGQGDAPNVTFGLAPDYPFSSNDSLVRNYGLLMGTISAYKAGMNEDASTVILKYRVKVADNAPDGTSDLKFYITTNSSDPSATSIGTDLPIVIGKTKTDFDVVMQDFTSQGASFSIANIGSNPATAVTVSIPPQAYVNISGASASIIGNLDKGDFTTVTFQIFPNRNLHELGVQVAYTDTAGVRDIIEKNVTVSMSNSSLFNSTAQGNFRQGTTQGTLMYAYLSAGILIGALAVFGYYRIRRKK